MVERFRFRWRLAATWMPFLVLTALAVGCAKPGPSPEEQARADAKRDRELQAEIAAAHLPYQKAAEAFLQSTAGGDFESAYSLLAASYTNMVPKETFVERAKTNKNFEKALSVKVLGTRTQAGTTHARCVVGELGLWEITFLNPSGGPRIAGITIGGMPALPGPS